MIPGELRQRMERYVSLRRALGFAMRAEERLLRAYVEFVAERDLSLPHIRSAAVAARSVHSATR